MPKIYISPLIRNIVISLANKYIPGIPGQPQYVLIDVCINKTHFLICACYRAPGIGFLAEFEHGLVSLRSCHYNGRLQFRLTCTNHLWWNFTDYTILLLQHVTSTVTGHTSPCYFWHDAGYHCFSDLYLITYHGQCSAPRLSKHDLIFCTYKLI